MWNENMELTTRTLPAQKHIALVAHDHCKDMLMKWVERGQVGLLSFAALLLLGVGIWYWRHKKQARASK